MNHRGLATVLLTMACAGPALADDAPCGFRLWLRPWLRVSDCPRLCGLPDDYCRKPCPTIIPAPRCGGPDDYCRKSPPCLTDVPRSCGVDDYCKKNIPCLLCPPVSPFLHYGAAGGCPVSEKRR